MKNNPSHLTANAEFNISKRSTYSRTSSLILGTNMKQKVQSLEDTSAIK